MQFSSVETIVILRLMSGILTNSKDKERQFEGHKGRKVYGKYSITSAWYCRTCAKTGFIHPHKHSSVLLIEWIFRKMQYPLARLTRTVSNFVPLAMFKNNQLGFRFGDMAYLNEEYAMHNKLSQTVYRTTYRDYNS